MFSSLVVYKEKKIRLKDKIQLYLMPVILFNIFENEIVHTEIRGRVYDFSKINGCRECIKTLLNQTQMKRFSVDFDASTIICVNILYYSKTRPENFNDLEIYPDYYNPALSSKK